MCTCSATTQPFIVHSIFYCLCIISFYTERHTSKNVINFLWSLSIICTFLTCTWWTCCLQFTPLPSVTLGLLVPILPHQLQFPSNFCLSFTGVLQSLASWHLFPHILYLNGKPPMVVFNMFSILSPPSLNFLLSVSLVLYLIISLNPSSVYL